MHKTPKNVSLHEILMIFEIVEVQEILVDRTIPMSTGRNCHFSFVDDNISLNDI